jgi:hypothetical protein
LWAAALLCVTCSLLAYVLLSALSAGAPAVRMIARNRACWPAGEVAIAPFAANDRSWR